MVDLDNQAYAAAYDNKLLEDFVNENERLILYFAQKTVKRTVTKNDDEWSIALQAFVSAVNNYNPEKGNFYSFAGLLIERRIIDDIRVKSRHNLEESVDPSWFTSDSESDYEDLPMRLSITKKLVASNDQSASIEISILSESLKSYGFGFFELVHYSPKSEKTKKACATAVRCLMSTPELLESLRNQKRLPIKGIEALTKVPVKVLERHRKYIIVVVEIMLGNYPFLSEYVRNMK